MKAVLILLFFLLQPTYLLSSQKMGVVIVPVTDLRSSSGSIATSHNYDSLQETQLLYGEPVFILFEQEGWLKVEAPEQDEFSHNQRWQGYPGWIKKEDVTYKESLEKNNSVVKKKSARLYSEPKETSSSIVLSIGTKLKTTGKVKNKLSEIVTPTGESAWIKKQTIRPFFLPSEKKARKLIIKSAKEFIGDLYFWGGRSAHLHQLKEKVTAVDCSGLSNLSFRVAGLKIPRDSYEQYLKSKRITKSELKMGDLIFSASKDKPDKVSHVTLYMGKEMIIEAPKSGEMVRKISFLEKYGISLKDLGVDGIAGNRILYFGTYFE